MPDTSQQPSFNSARQPAAPVATSVHWLAVDEDLALGCECADPSLQIERWGQEVQPFPQSAC